jgi:hypothetical protein
MDTPEKKPIAPSDGRSAQARRFRRLVRQFQAELGGDLSGAEETLIEQAALLTMKSEALRDAILQGDDVPEESLVRIANAVGRVVRDLRAAKGKRQQTKEPTLMRLMREKREQEARERGKQQ